MPAPPFPRAVLLVPVLVLSLMAVSACGDGTSATDSAAPDPVPQASPLSPSNTLFDLAREEGLSSFVMAVTQAGLESDLAGPGPLTVFAPTDAAFAALPPGTLDALLRPENQEALRTILAYHVLPESVEAGAITGVRQVETLAGEVLTAERADAVVVTDALGRTTRVLRADVRADNGILHVIEQVLLPAEPDDLLVPGQDLP